MVAYNLVPAGSSVFRAGGSEVGAWTKQGTADRPTVADRADSPTGSQLAWKSNAYASDGQKMAGGGTNIVLPGELWTPGAQYRIRALVWATTALSGRQYLYTPVQSQYSDPSGASGIPGSYARGELHETAGYYLDDVTVTLQEQLPGDYGAPTPPMDGEPVMLCVSAVAGTASGTVTAALAAIRVDRVEGWEEYGEMFHADDPSPEDWVIATEERAGYQVATITSTKLPDPDPDPDPDPEDPTDPEDPEPGDSLDPWDVHDQLVNQLAPRVAAFIGLPDDEDAVSTASVQLPIVAEYVRGYTRGKGWTGELPAMPLRVVIVSACARLASNPEQVSYYATGDYSERPAVLAGWTLAELAILRRYRRTAA